MQTELLKDCINKKVKDIYVTGYSEVRSNFNFFSPTLWWYYIEFDNYFLCVKSDETKGMLQISTHREIQCNFDIEEEDIFTVSSINKETYSKVIRFDLFCGNDDSNIYALGIFFENNKYTFFDSLNLDGIIVGNENDKDKYQQDNRFYIVKIN